MTHRVKDIIKQVPRIADLYECGAVQRAAVETLIDLVVLDCVKILCEEGNEKSSDAIWALGEEFGVDINETLDNLDY